MKKRTETTGTLAYANDEGEGPGAGQTISGRGLRTPRAAATAGILFAVLFTVGIVLIRLVMPYDPMEPGEWISDSGLVWRGRLYRKGAGYRFRGCFQSYDWQDSREERRKLLLRCGGLPPEW